jgi:ubiquinone/menaquinone biosynthesis C-methylase UbiE
VYGFDLSEIGPRIARQAGRSVARASVTAVPFPSDSFDLVTSFDVLYSLEPPDERAAVAEMFRLLKPGGYAIVNVAALEFLKGDHSVLSRELRRYTKASLGSLLQKGGFTIVRLTYTNATLLPLLAVLRAIQRARGLASESDAQREISVPSAAVNGLLSGVLWLESLWLRRFNEPLGSSLLCLAQKPITAQDEPRT